MPPTEPSFDDFCVDVVDKEVYEEGSPSLTASFSPGMFAACCNWMCVDSADDNPPGDAERHHQSYTNSAFSSQPSPTPPEPTCKACGGRLDTPAKKVTLVTLQCLVSVVVGFRFCSVAVTAMCVQHTALVSCLCPLP